LGIFLWVSCGIVFVFFSGLGSLGVMFGSSVVLLMFFLACIISSLLCILGLIVVLKGRIYPDEEDMTHTEQNVVLGEPMRETSNISVHCSQCGNRFSYQKNINGPTQVQCPYCGKVGTI